MLSSISAGTGPAATILAGLVIYLTGNTTVGIGLIVLGVTVSLLWALRFR